MEFHDINKINSIVSEISNVNLIEEFEQKEIFVEGRVSILDIKGLDSSLEFDVKIFPQYPLKNHNSESIKFINKDLIAYNHVMGDGSVCIHTLHSPDLKKKLHSDFESLKKWIVKYYINRGEDSHYEHIIVDEETFNNVYYSYQFTDIQHSFRKGEYGGIDLALLNRGIYKGKPISNYIVQSFSTLDGLESKCNWSKYYQGIEGEGINSMGIFIFIGDTPAHYERFVFGNWLDFEEYFSDDFLEFLYDFKQRHIRKYRKAIFPIFIGYETIDEEIHWVASICRMDDFPIEGVKIDRKWKSQLRDMDISWGITRNSSYKYLFGRGIFCNQIINSKKEKRNLTHSADFVFLFISVYILKQFFVLFA